MSSEINPYAAPASPMLDTEPARLEPDDLGTYWDDECLIVPKNAALAGYCVKCNAPADFLLRRHLRWHRPIYYWWLLVGIFFYFLVALVKIQKGHVYVALCPIHRRQRRRYMLIAWMAPVAWLLLVIVAGLVAAYVEDSDLFALAYMGANLVALGMVVYGYRRSRLVWPKKIDEKRIWLLGVTPEWGSSLPAG